MTWRGQPSAAAACLKPAVYVAAVGSSFASHASFLTGGLAVSGLVTSILLGSSTFAALPPAVVPAPLGAATPCRSLPHAVRTAPAIAKGTTARTTFIGTHSSWKLGFG